MLHEVSRVTSVAWRGVGVDMGISDGRLDQSLGTSWAFSCTLICHVLGKIPTVPFCRNNVQLSISWNTLTRVNHKLQL